MKRDIFNCSGVRASSWCFVEKDIKSDNLNWSHFTPDPKNSIESVISRPALSRYRSCFETVSNARRAKKPIIISHMPLTTLWISVFSRIFNLKASHLAFSFNFTNIPNNWMRRFMTFNFRSIERFVVYSSYEKDVYSKLFDIEKNKIDVLKWCMDKPDISSGRSVATGDYVCAAGGEGRDYKTLIKAAEKLIHLNFVILCRPANIPKIDIPENVKIFTDINYHDFWATVNSSSFVVLPLIDDKKACSHITLVGAFLLGKAVIGTRSLGTADYLIDGYTGLVAEPRDIDSLMEKIENLNTDTHLMKKLSANAKFFAENSCEPKIWADYVENFIKR